MLLNSGRPAGTVQATVGVAEPRRDVGVPIELVVDRRREDRYVGTHGLKHAYAVRRRQQRDRADAEMFNNSAEASAAAIVERPHEWNFVLVLIAASAQ
jgi:hypothetical protein